MIGTYSASSCQHSDLKVVVGCEICLAPLFHWPSELMRVESYLINE